MTFICIDTNTDTEVYPTNTTEEIEEAQAALRAAGLEWAKVWAGDPESGDHVTNGQILWAD